MAMKQNHEIMLITYADSLGRNLRELDKALELYFSGAVGGVHILPFFPSSGDRGFAPMRYDQVDPAFGDFEDIKRLAERYPLMFDLMVNHISAKSPYYQDFLQNKESSPYWDFFLRYRDFWPGGEPTESQVDMIYKRKPRAPYVEAEFADGSREKVWCTFSEEQIDLDVAKPVCREFLQETMKNMKNSGAAVIRLDAFAYAVKKPDTSCFFVEPEIWSLLEDLDQMAGPDTRILPEIHEHYTLQKKLADRGYWVYDFALPMLVLHTLYKGDGRALQHWLDICPRTQYTTLDTHDGIGVVDVKDLLTDQEIEETKELLFTKGANVKKIYNTAAYNNLDVYQVNCTYYSALGDRDDAYLLARAIQFFAPGIPMVYYVGLLAGRNDIELLEKTKEGRNINRHSYTLEEVEQETQRPVVKKLLKLMQFRNQHPAFQGNEIYTQAAGGDYSRLTITRCHGTEKAVLEADLKTFHFDIICTGQEKYQQLI